MLKILLKKQLTEVFRSFVYDAKKNRKRSKAGVIVLFVLYGFLLIGYLGGMFTGLSFLLCEGLTSVGMDWLYFAILSGIAIVLGAFGSVFSTYSGLYLAKDNDFLLSMPIPVRLIVISRLMNVYLIGSLYSLIVILPAIVVYWITVGIGIAKLIGGIILALLITLIVLILSCLLGWCVAKISVKLKNKSFVVVLISLAFIGLYYFVYFRATELIGRVVENAAVYGEKIKGAAYGLYLFGRIGEGYFPAVLLYLALILALSAAVMLLLSKSFLRVATSANAGAAVKKKAKADRLGRRPVFAAVLSKEFAKFTSNPMYMLNCGLGAPFALIAGAALLIKGNEVFPILESVFGALPGSIPVFLCAALCFLNMANDAAAPSVSLEAKTIWIYQSLPIEPKTVLRAKMLVQLLLSSIPTFFAAICGVIVCPGSLPEKLLIVVTSLLFCLFSSLFSSFLGVRLPNLHWSNELIPIKQGGAVGLSLLGNFLCTTLFAIGYFLIGFRIGAVFYLLLFSILFCVASVLLARYLDTKGSRIFASLA